MSFENKNDIKNIPFAKLYEKCKEAGDFAVEQAEIEALETHQYILDKKIAAAVQEYADTHEEGSEGVEEALREKYRELADPLSHEKVTMIRYKAQKEVVTEFCETHMLKSQSSWFLPQLLAYIGTWTAVKQEGIINPNLTLKANLRTEDGGFHAFNMGIFSLVMHSVRGDFVPDQSKDPNTNYCRLVPLILAAFKKYQNIPYSAWDRDKIYMVVAEDLANAMLCELPKLSTEEILEVRDRGLKVLSGKSAGTVRNPMTCHKVFSIVNPEVKALPEIAQVMLTQIWCAHPANRNSYMILDPSNWDKMPEPLVTSEALSTKPSTETKKFFSYKKTTAGHWSDPY